MTGLRGIGIYAIVNEDRRAAYIGGTLKGFHERWGEHQATLNHGTHKSQSLQSDWDSLGAAAFKIVSLEIVTDEEIMRAREQHWIDRYRDDGYALYNTARAEKIALPRAVIDHTFMTEEERREAGRRLAGFRTRKARKCPVCGKEFETWGKGIYCSTECRVKAWRANRRGE